LVGPVGPLPGSKDIQPIGRNVYDVVMTLELLVGKRYRSTACSTEVVVLASPGGDVDLTCGGAPLVQVGGEAGELAAIDPELAGGSLVGKRYTDAAGSVELLCTKAGAGSLALAGVPLSVKAAASLPASD
jgi:hypothetical protein